MRLKELLLLVSALSTTAASAFATPADGSFGFDVAGMDRSIRPGDDFYAYADGAWTKKAVIPPDEGRVAMFLQMQLRSLGQVRTILDDAARRPGTKIGDFYASFLDEAAIDRRGIAPIRPELDQLAAVTGKPALAAFAASAQRQGVGGMFAIPWGLAQMVSPDDRTPEAEIFHLRQGERTSVFGNRPSLASDRFWVFEPCSATRVA